MTMSNYIDHVYSESFNESISEFDMYVQESVGLIVGAVVGIAALITAVVLLIKRFFFKKDNPHCIWNSITSLELKLKTGEDKYGDVIWIRGIVDLASFAKGLQDMQEIIKLMNDMVYSITTNANVDTTITKLNALIKDAKDKFNKSYISTDKKWTKAEKREELLKGCERMKEMAKEIAKESKALAKANEKYKKDVNTASDNSSKKDFTKFHVTLMDMMKMASDKMDLIKVNVITIEANNLNDKGGD